MKSRWGMLALLIMGLGAVPLQADMVQCLGGVGCVGTNFADLINGSPVDDNIEGLSGNDSIFGGDGQDDIDGDDDDDLLFGGRGTDFLDGDEGNDIILPGPDDLIEVQESAGDEGNDTFIILVGETSNCQVVTGGIGQDILQLIGFGPYVATSPYGEGGFGEGYIIIEDIITGGLIFVHVEDPGEDTVETIHGLITPNINVLDGGTAQQIFSDNCTGT